MDTKDSTAQVNEFLKQFRKVEQHIKALAGGRLASADFRTIIAEAAKSSSTVDKESATLLSYHSLKKALEGFYDLRNALSHNSPAGDTPIAVLTAEGLQTFADIAEQILHPLEIREVLRPIKRYDPATQIRDVLKDMGENNYSQVVIWPSDEGEKRVAVLTVEGIARWMEHTFDQGFVQVGEVTVGEVLRYEPQGSFEVMQRSEKVEQARAAFNQPVRQEPEQTRLYAIIVTRHGKHTEVPEGIVTPWDLVALSPRRSQAKQGA